MLLVPQPSICDIGQRRSERAMKSDKKTGRYMTTGRTSAGKAVATGSFERVRSKGGEIVVTNTKRASDAFRTSLARDASSGKFSDGKKSS